MLIRRKLIRLTGNDKKTKEPSPSCGNIEWVVTTASIELFQSLLLVWILIGGTCDHIKELGLDPLTFVVLGYGYRSSYMLWTQIQFCLGLLFGGH